MRGGHGGPGQLVSEVRRTWVPWAFSGGSHCIASAVQALQAPPFCAALPFCSLRMGGQLSEGWGLGSAAGTLGEAAWGHAVLSLHACVVRQPPLRGFGPLGSQSKHTQLVAPLVVQEFVHFFTTLSLFTCQIQSVRVAEFILNELNITKFIYFKMSKFSQSRFF